MQQVDKTPIKFKKFKKRETAATSDTDNPFVSFNDNDSLISTIQKISFVDKLKILIENTQPLTQNDPAEGKIRQFSSAKIIDWSEDKGRFALAETVLKRNELEFAVMRQRMEVMADADGCGVRNERGGGIETGSLSSSITNLTEGRIDKLLGKKSEDDHKAGEDEHCKHNNDYGNCPQGCAKAA